MRWLLLKSIELYWRYFSNKLGKICIFKECCSKHVYRLTKEQGFFGGLKALIYRFRNCRGGYKLLNSPTGIKLIFSDGSQVSENEIASEIINQLH